jgi:hypothetical protein
MKKSRGDEPIVIIIHIYMEISLCSYLYLKQAKRVIFFFTKSENRRTEQILPRGKRGYYQWEGRGGGER